MFQARFFCIKRPETSESVSECPEMALSVSERLSLSAAEPFLYKAAYLKLNIRICNSYPRCPGKTFYFSSIETIVYKGGIRKIHVFQFYFSSIETRGFQLPRSTSRAFQFYFNSIETRTT